MSITATPSLEVVTGEVLARRFLDACAEIETTLKNRYEAGGTGLGTIVREVQGRDAVVRRNRAALDAFTALRNVLAHSSYKGGAPVAAPLSSTVEAIERLRDEISQPRRALDLAVRDVLTAHERDPLPGLLRVMASKDISQVPIYLADGSVRLLTTNAIARWVAAHLDSDDVVLIQAGEIAEALEHAEAHEVIVTEKRAVTAARVLDRLTRDEAPLAVLITETGRPGESPLGILSTADVPRLVQELTVTAY